ncbi:MAG: phosphoribosyl-ATP diphosphatase [Firmicutes bacterium]|nr:phosphoribosyl-ATP diphosphatase [Bacillota bacterium]
MGEKDIIRELYEVILDRKERRPAGSYTACLFERGVDQILKKIGEEAAEVIIAAKSGSRAGLVSEAADLLYHLLVLLAAYGLTPDDVLAELAARREKKA